MLLPTENDKHVVANVIFFESSDFELSFVMMIFMRRICNFRIYMQNSGAECQYESRGVGGDRAALVSSWFNHTQWLPKNSSLTWILESNDLAVLRLLALPHQQKVDRKLF